MVWSGLRGLHLEIDADLVADQQAARLEGDVPLETPLLAADLGAGAEAGAGTAPGIGERSEILEVERHRAGDIEDGELTVDLIAVLAGRAHGGGAERDLG